jgi:hypothetical protein
MNLKNIKYAPGTGALIANTNGQDQVSSTDAYNYMITILQLFVSFFLFCYVTTCNYLNARLIDTDEDYPVGATLDDIIKKGGENPYGSRFLKCKPIGVESSDKVQKINWWWQETQESSYHLGGWVLHNYFNFTKKWIAKITDDTSILSFILWMLFGAWTQLSMIVMLYVVFLTCIVGWFSGLFAFSKLNGNGVNKFWLFCISAALTFVFGLVSVFPIFYEFIYLIYLFFIKRLISDPDKVSDEFTKRMSYLIVVFVIVALIIAASQLPATTAGAMAVVVFLVGLVSHLMKGYGSKAAVAAVGAVVDAANDDGANGYMPVSQNDSR